MAWNAAQFIFAYYGNALNTARTFLSRVHLADQSVTRAEKFHLHWPRYQIGR